MNPKTVLITGGSRGIGAACVRAFYAAGWSVAFCFRQATAEADALARECPGVLAVRADVSVAEQVVRLYAETCRTFGTVDLLICNAGIAQQKLLTDVTETEWDVLFDTNVKGMFLCIRAVLPDMIRRHCGGILTVSSMWGQVGASCEVPYSAAKAAVIGLSKSLAKEVGPSGIRVNCIAPGVIATDMNAALDPPALAELREETPLGTLGSPADIAAAALFLASDAAAFITGQVLGVNGGFVI